MRNQAIDDQVNRDMATRTADDSDRLKMDLQGIQRRLGGRVPPTEPRNPFTRAGFTDEHFLRPEPQKRPDPIDISRPLSPIDFPPQSERGEIYPRERRSPVDMPSVPPRGGFIGQFNPNDIMRRSAEGAPPTEGMYDDAGQLIPQENTIWRGQPAGRRPAGGEAAVPRPDPRYLQQLAEQNDALHRQNAMLDQRLGQVRGLSEQIDRGGAPLDYGSSAGSGVRGLGYADGFTPVPLSPVQEQRLAEMRDRDRAGIQNTDLAGRMRALPADNATPMPQNERLGWSRNDILNQMMADRSDFDRNALGDSGRRLPPTSTVNIYSEGRAGEYARGLRSAENARQANVVENAMTDKYMRQGMPPLMARMFARDNIPEQQVVEGPSPGVSEDGKPMPGKPTVGVGMPWAPSRVPGGRSQGGLDMATLLFGPEHAARMADINARREGNMMDAADRRAAREQQGQQFDRKLTSDENQADKDRTVEQGKVDAQRDANRETRDYHRDELGIRRDEATNNSRRLDQEQARADREQGNKEQNDAYLRGKVNQYRENAANAQTPEERSHWTRMADMAEELDRGDRGSPKGLQAPSTDNPLKTEYDRAEKERKRNEMLTLIAAHGHGFWNTDAEDKGIARKRLYSVYGDPQDRALADELLDMEYGSGETWNPLPWYPGVARQTAALPAAPSRPWYPGRPE